MNYFRVDGGWGKEEGVRANKMHLKWKRGYENGSRRDREEKN